MPHSSVAADAGVGYDCRELTQYSEFREAAALYARVFAYTEQEYALNANLLTALARNGGSAVGAFADDGGLIGFAYGFAGCDASGTHFHYSQAAAVDARADRAAESVRRSSSPNATSRSGGGPAVHA